MNDPQTWLAFRQKLQQEQVELNRGQVKTLQVNLGKLCNLACQHCHVGAGPQKKRENMSRQTVERMLQLLDASPAVRTVDMTGGAPELNPNFRFLVQQAHQRGLQLIDRCNLTVLYEPGQEDTAAFLAARRVKIVASLPCYSKDNVEQQRGDGVFAKSIAALQMLGQLGYGQEGSELELDLVYNPLGPHLPPEQQALEEEYKQILWDHFQIKFNRLLTITNMPIKRFLYDLNRKRQTAAYMDLLCRHFNRTTVPHLMCRSMISVGWDGQLYDCDFNQMLELPLGCGRKTLWDVESFVEFHSGAITTADHCYGCTAGAGSSCGGTVT
ncbi:MAG: arsenosugar biosynthesis radical SAM protein ArsS [Zetaproteobacteria bacterium]|nr:arsenosugar biosynthesis radical SAM protein ArsS [Zetaproteobacteria bacterium]